MSFEEGRSGEVGFVSKFLWACIVVFLSVTTLVSLIFTAFLPKYDYTIEFSIDPVVAAAALILLLFIILGFYRLYIQIGVSAAFIEKGVFLYVFVLSVVWALIASVWMEWDPLSILEAALGIGHSDSVFFESGQYIFRFPYQVPLVLLFKLYLSIFGTAGIYHALELTIALCNAISVFLVGRIASSYTEDERCRILALLVAMFFFPLYLYTTFVYGNSIALPFCLAGIYFQSESIRMHSLWRGLASGLFFVVGYIIKSSYLLFLVAGLFVWASVLLRKRESYVFAALFTTLILYVGSGCLVKFSAIAIGVDPSQEMPKTAVLAMGLQETDPINKPNNKGWYNGYLWTWPSDEYDIETVKSDSLESLNLSISRFLNDPMYAVDFFSKKYISEWCEPTYESLLASNWCGESGRSGHGAMNQRPMTRLLRSIYYGKIHSLLLFIENGLQTLILLGGLFHFLFGKYKFETRTMCCALFAAGSALFYLLWEAQAQYIMPCYIALIPYAASWLNRLFLSCKVAN